MRDISKNNTVLARHILEADVKSGLNFFSNDEEFIQVGVWEYNTGKELNKHIHNKFEREINRTYEVLYIIEGSIRAFIYDIDENFVEELVVNKGEILILLESGHGYEIMSESTRVLEVKNGPYYGPEKDRYRF